MNAIVPASTTAMAFAEIERLGMHIAKSGLFGIKTPEAAVSLMMIAQAEGRHPALAARDYDIINGRPAKRAEAMHRDFLEAGGKIQWLALSDTEAKATFSHPQGGEVTLSWDMERATKAGFASKPNYKAYPRQMLRSRLISEGVRTVWPGATSGAHVPEEVQEMEPFDGTTIEHDKPADRREQINRDVPVDRPAQAERTPTQLLEAFAVAVKECGSLEAYDKLIANRHVQHMLKTFKGDDKARLDGIIASGVQAYAPVTHSDEDWPDDELPHIKGEEFVNAG